MKIKIITDSTSDISQKDAKDKGIVVVPLKVLFGQEEYRDGIDMETDSFYQKLCSEDEVPTTSQPSPADFLKVYEEAKDANESIIVITISEKLSGTYQSAVIAKDLAEYDSIYVVDSMNTVTGLRILVDHAIKMRDEGKEIAEIVNKLEEIKHKIVLFGIVDTLEYLHKGGRLSRSSSIIGSFLNFKPIINLKDGLINAVGKTRGFNKAVFKVYDLIEELGGIDDNYPVVFGYTAESSKAIILKEKIQEKYNLKNTSIFPVGAVVGTHAGPGASVITYVKK
ncbi:MAG TPA: DegV family protein [Clostridiales bacterium]|nr:DegV family protein [Clostridiales bacterium]